jgi:NAD(P)-dependent dehydrogenase (short-subunit alcohol dehydrogenase family)
MSTIAISGAGRGIGLSLAKLYVARGDRVIALVRRQTPELAALNIEIVEGVDVTDDSLATNLSNKLPPGEIDLLINNSGVFTTETLSDAGMDLASIRRQFEVNTLGPLRLTQAILPRLSAQAKIGIVSSRMGSIADNTSGGYYGYRVSKAGVNAIGRSLAHDLAARGIAVALLHPGYVRTDMTGGHGDLRPDESARGLVTVLDQLNLQNSGRFWHQNGQELPW